MANKRESITSPIEVMALIGSYWTSQAIIVAANLGIADLLKDKPLEIDELALKVGANSEYLYRVMRSLASIGIFSEIEGKKFQMTAAAECLRSDHPFSVRSMAIMHGESWHWDSWGKLTESVKKGIPGIELALGSTLFEFLSKHPEKSKNFSKTMESITARVVPTLVQDYNFGQFSTLVDVGGAFGTLLTGIMKAHPTLKGVLFDLPAVISQAKNEIKEPSVADRLSFFEGDFFSAFPHGADAYILKYILHDWDDERAIKLLEQGRKALTKKSKLLIIEQIISPGNAPERAKYMDLEMMAVTPGGKERTEEEFRFVIDQAGLKVANIIRTNSTFFIIEAVA